MSVVLRFGTYRTTLSGSPPGYLKFPGLVPPSPRPFHLSPITMGDPAKSTSSSQPVTAGPPTGAAPSVPWSTMNKPETPASKKQAKPPSPSASIILISPTNQVLLLHRFQTSSAFPSAHVFPGGNLEPSDGTLPPSHTDPARHVDNMAYRTGAIRELFEESGILLARQTSSPDSPLLVVPAQTRLKARDEIHNNRINIHTWLSTQSPSAVLDTDALIPFSRWITPTNVPKRFTTQMYIYFLPVSARDSKSLIATSDEVETMAPEWQAASEWLLRARSGEIILFPPQFLLLSFVSQFLDSSSTASQPSEMEIEERRQKLIQFVNKDANPSWREKIISPRVLLTRDGQSILGIDKPSPELKDVESAKGDDTRVVLVRFSKEGPRDVQVRFKKEFMEEERKRKEGQSKL